MTIQELNALIDQVVAPQKGGPKVKGPALNNLLRNLAAEVEASNGDASTLAALSAALDAQKTRLDTLAANVPQALDTLKELADQLAADEQGAAAILATQQQHTQQLANDVVHKTGDEAIAGNKTLQNGLVVQNSDPSKVSLLVTSTVNVEGGGNQIRFNFAGSYGSKNQFSLAAQGQERWALGNDIMNNGSQNFYLYNTQQSNTPVFVNANGNVGIGIMSSYVPVDPAERLEVGGNIKAQQFIGDGYHLDNVRGVVSIYAYGNLSYLNPPLTGVVYHIETGPEASNLYMWNGAGFDLLSGESNTVHKTGDEAIHGSKHFKQSVAVDGNVTATAFVGDGSQLTGLPAGADVNKAYVDAADTALGTCIDANSAAIATQLETKAIRVVKATRERVFYTGVGTAANPSLDGLKQALAAAQPGDTVEQITNAALQGVGYNSEQVRVPAGVNFNSNGFALDSRGTKADAMTLLGGKGIIFGNHSTLYHETVYTWGLGWYNDTVDTDYVVYDLNIKSSYSGAGRKAYCSVVYNVGNLVHYGDIDAIVEDAACYIGSIGFPYQPGQVCNYTHYGRLTINQQTIGLRAENVGRILHVGDLVVKDTTSTAGLALNNGQIEMRSGVLDLTAASAQGGFMLNAKGKLTLTDVRVVGGHLPAIPTTSSQGAGATLVLRGTTSGFDKILIDPLITVIDEREIAFNSHSEDDDALFAFQVGTSYNPSHFHLATLTIKQLRQLIYDADTQYPGYSTVSITTDEAAGHRHTVVVTYDPQKHALQVLRVENEDGAEQQNHTAYPIVGDANYAKLEGGNTFVGSQAINGGSTYGTYQSDRVVLQGENSLDVRLTPSSLAFNAGINVAAGSVQATGPGVLTVSTTHFKVPAPSESDDAATKAYVDARSGGGGVSGNYLPAAVDPNDPGGQYLVTSAVSFSQGELIVGPPSNDYDAVNAQWVGDNFLRIDFDTHAVTTPLKFTNGSGATLTLDVTTDGRPTVNGQVLGSGFTPSNIQSALVNSGNTNWSYGEYAGSLPAGSVPGMKFRATNNLNQAYVFEYLLAGNDVNGTRFSWSRYSSS